MFFYPYILSYTFKVAICLNTHTHTHTHTHRYINIYIYIFFLDVGLMYIPWFLFRNTHNNLFLQIFRSHFGSFFSAINFTIKLCLMVIAQPPIKLSLKLIKIKAQNIYLVYQETTNVQVIKLMSLLYWKQIQRNINLGNSFQPKSNFWLIQL